MAACAEMTGDLLWTPGSSGQCIVVVSISKKWYFVQKHGSRIHRLPRGRICKTGFVGDMKAPNSVLLLSQSVKNGIVVVSISKKWYFVGSS
jgi:hypothetical protein